VALPQAAVKMAFRPNAEVIFEAILKGAAGRAGGPGEGRIFRQVAGNLRLQAAVKSLH
jgi:hypothetical protein